MTRTLILLPILIALLWSCDNQAINNSGQEIDAPTVNINPTLGANTSVSQQEEKPFTERDLKYKGQSIKITHHARCRMGCREIEALEIQEIINKKQINPRKTNYNPPAGKCPSIAYEGRTSRDQQKLRIILGECEDKPIIITVIDLENKYQCNCK